MQNPKASSGAQTKLTANTALIPARNAAISRADCRLGVGRVFTVHTWTFRQLEFRLNRLYDINYLYFDKEGITQTANIGGGYRLVPLGQRPEQDSLDAHFSLACPTRF